jgi:hypothetical protein
MNDYYSERRHGPITPSSQTANETRFAIAVWRMQMEKRDRDPDLYDAELVSNLRSSCERYFKPA